MNTREIEALLVRYYDGDTSLADEKVLRDFFSGTDVPEHLKPHQPLFAFYVSEQGSRIDDGAFLAGLETKLTDVQSEIPVVPIRTNRSRMLYFSGIAASVLLVLGLFFTFRQDVFKEGSSFRKPYNTDLAYAQASEALLIVSSNLNNGLKEVSRLQAVDQAMNKMQLLNKFYQYQPIIINPGDLNQTPKK